MHTLTFCNVEQEHDAAFKGTERDPVRTPEDQQWFWIAASRGSRIKNFGGGDNRKIEPQCVLIVDKSLRVEVWPQRPPLLEFETASAELGRRMTKFQRLAEYRSSY